VLVKKSLIALVVLAACAPKVTTTTTTAPVGSTTTTPAAEPPRTSSSLTGGTSARAAVQEFLDAVKSQDIQAMSVLFGTSHGPARDNMNREELEKRLVILQCYFNHDKARFVSENPGDQGHRVVQFELTRGQVTRTPAFYSIQGPGGRWYVDNMEIAAVRDFCRNSNG
jgi:hypothetical protein